MDLQNKSLDFWKCATYTSQRSPSCRHFHWVEDQKNVGIRQRKKEECLIVMEKKMDQLLKLMKVVGVLMLIFMVVRII